MAASASVTSVLAWRAPQFVSPSEDPRLAGAESAAIAWLPEVDCLGGRYWLAVALLCAHWLSMADRGSAAAGGSAGAGVGAVTSATTSRLSLAFGAIGAQSTRADMAAMRSTQYGAELADLLASSPCTVPSWAS